MAWTCFIKQLNSLLIVLFLYSTLISFGLDLGCCLDVHHNLVRINKSLKGFSFQAARVTGLYLGYMIRISIGDQFFKHCVALLWMFWFTWLEIALHLQ